MVCLSTSFSRCIINLLQDATGHCGLGTCLWRFYQACHDLYLQIAWMHNLPHTALIYLRRTVPRLLTYSWHQKLKMQGLFVTDDAESLKKMAGSQEIEQSCPSSNFGTEKRSFDEIYWSLDFESICMMWNYVHELFLSILSSWDNFHRHKLLYLHQMTLLDYNVSVSTSKNKCDSN